MNPERIDRFHVSQEFFVNQFVRPHTQNQRVIDAFLQVDRATFAPSTLRLSARTNAIIPLGEHSSISEPSLIAQMIDALNLTGSERVLEIGTASGYTAALLSHCAAEVHTIEYDEELANHAKSLLFRLGYENVYTHIGDGAKGVPETAPYDAIIVTAHVRSIPPELTKQLKPRGRIVVPMGKDPRHGNLFVGKKVRSEIVGKPIQKVRFHPLYSDQEGGWTEDLLNLLQKVKMRYVDHLASEQGLSENEFLSQNFRRLYGLDQNMNISYIDYQTLVDCIEVPDEEYERLMNEVILESL